MASSTDPLAGRNFQDENGTPIVPGEKLGEGGEGVVHLVDGQPGSVMKIWHPGRTPEDAETKIHHLVNNPVGPELGETWHITWPQHAVLENGVIAGYTMPILNPGESWEPIVEYYNRRAAQTTGAAQAREIRIDDRVRMARNLALGFRAVHNAGYVIGDVNEKNVEVNRQNDIAMVDCDSYGFTDSDTGRTFSNGMGRPEFQAPEAQGDFANRTQNHDLFGLAVIIFHLLTGYQPYTVTNQPDYPLPGDRISAGLFPPARSDVTAPAPYDESWNALTDRQRELFLRCFDPGNYSQLRPSPEEWLEALLEMPDVAQPPLPQPQPQPQPQPTPAPQRQPTPQPQPRPRPGRRFTVLVWFLARFTGDTPLLYLGLAAAGYAALIPLLVADEFNIRLWLALTLLAGLLLYDPAQKLFQSPISGLRWFLITVTALVSAYFLFELAETAISVWPWWMWLGMGLATGFVFLVPARGVFNRSNPRRRRVAIGAFSLVGIFIMGSLIWSVDRDYWTGELGPLAGLSQASANGGAVAPGNAAPAGGGSEAASGVPLLAAIPEETPTPTPAATPDIKATVA